MPPEGRMICNPVTCYLLPVTCYLPLFSRPEIHEGCPVRLAGAGVTCVLIDPSPLEF